MSSHKRSRACVRLLVRQCPALAEIDLSGSWQSINHEDALERGGGPNPDDWAGLPFNESGRAKALSFSQSVISMPERTCWFQTQWHIAAGPFSLRMWAVPDPITGKVQAWMVGAWETRAPMTIWMDGRPHPSKNAPHDQTGFTTGVWNGNELDRDDDAPEDRLHPPQRRGEQRPGDHHHALPPARRHADADAVHGRSGLSDRAVHPHALVQPEHQSRRHRRSALHRRRRRRRVGPRAALSARQEPVHRRDD